MLGPARDEPAGGRPERQRRGHRRLLPPRLRSPETERHATWLELFFDLVFVVALSGLTSLLSHDVSPRGAGTFLAYFVPLWWTWVGHTIYSNYFDTDDVVHRAWTYGIMLSTLVIAVLFQTEAPDAAKYFALAMTGSHLCLMGLYARAWVHVPPARPQVQLYLLGFGLGTLLWVVSLAVPVPWRFLLWGLAMGVELVTPMFGWRLLERAPLNPSHFPERFGLFTLMVLGETIWALVRGVSDVQWGPLSVITAFMAFGIAIALWWMYFTFVSEAEIEETLGSGLAYLYGHLPLIVGLEAIGVGLEHAIPEAVEKVPSSPLLLLLGGGTLVWVVFFLLLHLATTRRKPMARLMGAFVGGMVVVALVMTYGAFLPPPVLILGILAVFSGLAYAEARHFRRFSEGVPFDEEG